MLRDYVALKLCLPTWAGNRFTAVEISIHWSLSAKLWISDIVWISDIISSCILHERRNKIGNIVRRESRLTILPILFLLSCRIQLDIISEIQTISERSMLTQIFFYNSSFPATIRAWNNLSDDTKQSPSVTSSFKFRLNRNLIKLPKFYNIGSRKGQIPHSGLRMECTSLNSHLFRKNPSCAELLKAHIMTLMFTCLHEV